MIELRPLAELDPALVTANLAESLERIQQDNPAIDVRRGVFAELLVYYHAVLDTQRQQNIDDYLKGRSLQAIQADPTLADPDLVDDVLSNFRVDRKPGRLATGTVTMVVNDNVTVTIGQGAIFDANGRTFVTTTAYTAKLEEAQILLAGDRLLTPTASGNWAFTITVTATDEGADFNVKKDTLIIPRVLPPGYVNSFAAEDFTAGLSAETNDELLTRLQSGIAAKALSNRVNMQASLRAIEAFSRIVHMSIVGYGDAEMHRDRHWIFPVSGGGRCDWYVRTQEEIYRTKLTVAATLLTKTATTVSTWQFAVGRDDAPGFYEFESIRPADRAEEVQGGFGVTSDVRGYDLTGLTFAPDLIDEVEAAYSRYATAVVQFEDTETDVSAMTVGDQVDYVVEAVGMPLIGDIQDYVASRDIRNHAADCLIRSPVPCFLQLNFTLYKKAGEADPDLASIRTALCVEVNNIGFVGRLYASQLQDAIYVYLTNNQTVGTIDLFGRIRDPNGEVRYLRDGEKLEVPSDPEACVTPRTVQFFITPNDIGIDVVTNIPDDA